MRSLEVKRLNADCSAVLTIDGVKVLVDPWLVGSEVDGSPLFNEAWHVNPVASVHEVNLMSVDLIVISLPFADHLHVETLALLDPELPIVVNQEGAAILRKEPLFATRKILKIPSYPEFLDVKFENSRSLSFSSLAPHGILDYTHGGMIIRSQISKRRQEHLLWAPHGIRLGQDYSHPYGEQLKSLKWVLVAVTMSTYKLPVILGGTVNLGLADGVKLVTLLRPRFVIDIHSEQKASRGLVSLVANPKYPTMEEKKSLLGEMYVPCEGLEAVKFY